MAGFQNMMIMLSQMLLAAATNWSYFLIPIGDPLKELAANSTGFWSQLVNGRVAAPESLEKGF